MKTLVKKLAFVLIGTIVSISIHAQSADVFTTPIEIKRGQYEGADLYEDGKLEEAFAVLSMAAQRGMKTAQYLLGFMFLKGEYVDQSLLVGMAWLGVAGEADHDDWHATYKQIHDSLPANVQAAVDAKLAIYVELYGVGTQKIRCARRARTGQRRLEEICDKNGSDTPLYSLEGVPENFVSRIGSCDEPWPCQLGTLFIRSDIQDRRDIGAQYFRNN